MVALVSALCVALVGGGVYVAAGRLGLPRPLLLLLAGVALGSIHTQVVTTDVSFLRSHMDVLGPILLTGVLFYGGLSVQVRSARASIRPALLMATVGALFTSGVLATALYAADRIGLFHLVQFTFPVALTLGAILAPNDPIAVFSAIRTTRSSSMSQGIAGLESGLDDAVVSTLVLLVLAPLLVRGIPTHGAMVGSAASFLWAIISAVALGAGGGVLLQTAVERFRLHAAPAVLASAFFVGLLYLLGTLLGSSAYVAVFIAGVSVRYRAEGARWAVPLRPWLAYFAVAEVAAFIPLGAVVHLTDLSRAAGPALVAGATLALLARPLQVSVFGARSGLTWHDRLYLTLIALKGLSPAVLALVVTTETHRYLYLADIVFLVTLIVMLVQGVGLSVFGALAHVGADVPAEISASGRSSPLDQEGERAPTPLPPRPL